MGSGVGLLSSGAAPEHSWSYEAVGLTEAPKVIHVSSRVVQLMIPKCGWIQLGQSPRPPVASLALTLTGDRCSSEVNL